MVAEKQLRGTRYVFRWQVVTYRTKNSFYSLSVFCTQSAVCILYWPIGVACDKTDLIFSLGAISCFVYFNTILDSGAKPVEIHVYNRNTSSHFPNCSLFFSFVRHVEFLGGLPLYTRSQTLVLGSLFPFPRSPFPVLVTSKGSSFAF